MGNMEGRNAFPKAWNCTKQCYPSCPLWLVIDLRKACRDQFLEKMRWMKTPVSATHALLDSNTLAVLKSCSKFLLSYCQAVEVAACTYILHPLPVFKRAVFSTSSAYYVSHVGKQPNSNNSESSRQRKKALALSISPTISEILRDPEISLTSLLGRRKRFVAFNDCHWNTCKIRALSSHHHKSIREESRRKLPVLGMYFP